MGIKKKENRNSDSLVVQPGFEPRLTEPKSGVLPLHHWTIFQAILFAQKRVQNYEVFFNPANLFSKKLSDREI